MGVFYFTVKAGSFVKSLRDSVSASCPAGDGSNPNLSPLPHIRGPATTMLVQALEWGVRGQRASVVFLTEAVPPRRKTFKIQ